MDSNIILVNNKSQYFEFDLVVEGLDSADCKVRFTLYSNPYDISISCTPKGQDKWCFTIPPLPFMEITTYNFCISAVVDGYYFEAHKGILTLTKTPEVYVRGDDLKQHATAPEVKDEQPKLDRVSDVDRDALVAAVMKDAAETASGHKEEPKKEEPQIQFTIGEEPTIKAESPAVETKKQVAEAPVDKKISEAEKIAAEILKENVKPAEKQQAKSVTNKKPSKFKKGNVVEAAVETKSKYTPIIMPEKPPAAKPVNPVKPADAIVEHVVRPLTKQEQAIKEALKPATPQTPKNNFKKGETVVK